MDRAGALGVVTDWAELNPFLQRLQLRFILILALCCSWNLGRMEESRENSENGLEKSFRVRCDLI